MYGECIKIKKLIIIQLGEDKWYTSTCYILWLQTAICIILQIIICCVIYSHVFFYFANYKAAFVSCSMFRWDAFVFGLNFK